MLLERTLTQLDIGYVRQETAEKLGHLGYAQWLGALPGHANYLREAHHARELARPFVCTSPAVAVFYQLLTASIDAPLAPLALKLPAPARRGGARARRDAL